MPQLQTGFLDRSRVGSLAPAQAGEFDQAVSFRFVVTWSALSTAVEAPRPLPAPTPAIHSAERGRSRLALPSPRVMPAPTNSVSSASESTRAFADEVVPGGIKKSRAGPGFQWEMVVPKMVRTARKPAAATSPRRTTANPSGVMEPAGAEQSAPNLYTGGSSFRKTFSFKFCVGMAALGIVAVPMWRHSAHPAAEIETSVEGGEWLRQAAIAGDPGVKQSRQLVLYRPSLKAADSRFEFDWKTDSGNLGMIFRAKNLGNYYAVRLKLLNPGSNATLSAEYFSVYQFVESLHREKVLVLTRNDPTLHVRMEIFGPTFTLYLQNNATEYWTDAQMASGAIGFFEEWNRSAEIHGLRISFPQRSQIFEAPIPELRRLLTAHEPRLFAGARSSALGGV